MKRVAHPARFSKGGESMPRMIADRRTAPKSEAVSGALHPVKVNSMIAGLTRTIKSNPQGKGPSFRQRYCVPQVTLPRDHTYGIPQSFLRA